MQSITLLLLTSFLFGSCAKEGCTDTDSTSYSADAKKDDGTCRYEGSTVFWFNQSTSQDMITDGIQSLFVYVDDELIGTIDASDFFTSAPDCGADKAVSVTKDMFSAKSRAYSYRIIDNNSDIRRAGTLMFNGNQCENFEIVYFP